MENKDIIKIVIICVILWLAVFKYFKNKDNKKDWEENLINWIKEMEKKDLELKKFRDELEKKPLSKKIINKDLENKELIKKVKKFENKYNEKYFNEKEDIYIGKENFEWEDLDEEDEEYILVSITEVAELYLWEENFYLLEDNFSKIEWIGEIFWEDRETFLIKKELCKISEKVIKIEILNIVTINHFSKSGIFFVNFLKLSLAI